MKRLITIIIILYSSYAIADTVKEVRNYRLQNEQAILQEFMKLLAIPNLASDDKNIRANAEHIRGLMEKRGIVTRLLESKDSPPAILGEWKVAGAKHTVGIYIHYDGQPVDPSQWTGEPWKPVLRDAPVEEGGKEVLLSSAPVPVPPEWRIYARSSSDDKAPIIGWLTALDALKAMKMKPSMNLKFLLDGEEEAGSPHLPAILQQYSSLLSADVWLFCDGPVHQSRQRQVFFGARGVMGFEMTIYGPLRSLHSGHYGNWAPNPIAMLAELLSSMRDSNGNIKVAHFLDHVRPLTESEKKALADVPSVEADLQKSLALGRTESKSLVSSIVELPAFNFRGVQAGHVGKQATNSIPTEASASIDIRLVPDLTPPEVRKNIEDHIRAQGFQIVYETPDPSIRRQYPKVIKLEWEEGYPAARTPIDLPVCQAAVKTIESNLGSLIKMPSLGGSIPMYLFTDVLKTPVIGVPIANHDNNQHAANENLRLQNLWDGIELFAVLLADLEKNW
jgi:acetylornithine deacetylase/succinyl-diaminopimelate desuccinylase-like protein